MANGFPCQRNNFMRLDDTFTFNITIWKDEFFFRTAVVNQADDENGGLAGSAVINDDETTGGQPKRIIPLDRKLFPDAEIAGEKKKPNTVPRMPI